MFEIYCCITDHYGSRTVPTGDGFTTEAAAQAVVDKLEDDLWKEADASRAFYVQWVPADDAWIVN